jgi:pyruvate kinase
LEERKTKIMATLGPACREQGIIEAMIEAGMDVARINASHADEETIKEETRAIREASRKVGREVSIVLDLMGPKIRVGDIEDGEIILRDGQEFILTSQVVPGDSVRISVSNPDLPAVLVQGDTVLMDDGALRLKVESTTAVEVKCKVEIGGVLKPHKGINLPGVSLKVPPYTEKDLGDIIFGLESGIDWIALSFVQSSADIKELRSILRERGSSTPIIAKIEKRAAVEDIEAIVREADAVMVARGDLGVEMDLEDIPLLQKKIIGVAARQGKPVITATQMLQSMITNPSPTRAEVTDVANAVLDGTDVVMLSGETAVGSFPVESVATMRRIITRAETALPYAAWLEDRRRWISSGMVEAVCFAACELAQQIQAKAIVAPTESGFTARQMSRFRPRQPILAPTPEIAVVRQLTLFWGVSPRLVAVRGRIDDILASAREVAKKEGYLQDGDTVVVTAGVEIPKRKGVPTTNTIHCITGR